MKVRDMRETISLDFENAYGDRITDRLFVSGIDDKNYSKKVSDLLSIMPDSVIKDIVEHDMFSSLEGQELRIRIQRTEGNYIEKVNGGFIIRGVGPEVFDTYGKASVMLSTVGNRAYLRVTEFADIAQLEDAPKGVW